MIWIYRLLFPLLFLVSLPYYLMRMWRRGGYREMMASRFGGVELVPKGAGKRRIWIQAVSVGELLAIESLVRQLAAMPDVELVITTTTSTGYRLAKEKYGESAILISSFPFDFWPIVRKTWGRIQPDLAIITEGELWPEHIRTARDKGIPLILINARLSDRSYRRMNKFRVLQSLFYKHIAHIAASSELDAQRILSLGYPEEKLSVAGNLKFDVVDPEGMDTDERMQLFEETGFSQSVGSKIVIGASTWPGEEELLIRACVDLLTQGLQVRLLLVPRHAERRGEIHEVLEKQANITWRFRSQPEWIRTSETEGALQVYIADTTGELRKFIQLADLAVIGKSFPPHLEGQTPVEAVALGTPVIYGPSMTNFRAICADLEQSGGAIRIREIDQLTPTLGRLLRDSDECARLKQAAREVFEHSRGSTERTIALIKSYF